MLKWSSVGALRYDVGSVIQQWRARDGERFFTELCPGSLQFWFTEYERLCVIGVVHIDHSRSSMENINLYKSRTYNLMFASLFY